MKIVYLLLLFFLKTRNITDALNIVNGMAFGSEAITSVAIRGYLKNSLVLGAAASGIYSMGKDATKVKVAAIVKKIKAKSTETADDSEN